MPTPQFNVRIDLDLKEAFFEKARSEDTNASELIVGWIKSYLGIEEPVKVIPSDVLTKRIDDRLALLESQMMKRVDARVDEQLKKRKAA